MNNLELEVINILNADEKILNFSFAKKTKSAYFIMIKGESEYITFRISNHPTSSFYSNRTFNNTEILRQYFINHPQSIDKYTFLQNSAFTHWVKEKCSKMC